LPRRILLMLIVPPVLVLVGTVGYHFLEGMTYFESLHFTITTITTVGYGDLVPETVGGRIFTMFLILSGVFTMFYAVTALIRTIVGGELAEHLGRQQMERTLAQMKDHIIVCGYGRMGKLVCGEFAKAEIPFVVIDENAELLRGFAVPYGVPLVG